MKRVVITGVGIVSSIGVGREAVRESLRQGRSGIVFSPEYHELGFRSHVHGALEIDLDEVIERKHKRFMGDSASYNYIALKEAVDDACVQFHHPASHRPQLPSKRCSCRMQNLP